MLARKDKIVGRSPTGIAFLFKKNKITWLPRATASSSPASASTIAEHRRSTSETVAAKHVIIATGSKPRAAAGRRRSTTSTILDNDGALAFDAVPEAPRRDRRRRHRPRAGQRLAPAGLGGDDPRSAAGVPRRGRRDGREGSARRSSPKQGLDIQLGRQDHRGRRRAKNGVTVDYTDADGPAQNARVRPADRVGRPRAEHRRPRRRRRRA